MAGGNSRYPTAGGCKFKPRWDSRLLLHFATAGKIQKTIAGMSMSFPDIWKARPCEKSAPPVSPVTRLAPGNLGFSFLKVLAPGRFPRVLDAVLRFIRRWLVPLGLSLPLPQWLRMSVKSMEVSVPPEPTQAGAVAGGAVVAPCSADGDAAAAAKVDMRLTAPVGEVGQLREVGRGFREGGRLITDSATEPSSGLLGLRSLSKSSAIIKNEAPEGSAHRREGAEAERPKEVTVPAIEALSRMEPTGFRRVGER